MAETTIAVCAHAYRHFTDAQMAGSEPNTGCRYEVKSLSERISTNKTAAMMRLFKTAEVSLW